MTEVTNDQSNASRFQLTTDWWAVIAALVAALLVRLGLIQRVPW